MQIGLRYLQAIVYNNQWYGKQEALEREWLPPIRLYD